MPIIRDNENLTTSNIRLSLGELLNTFAFLLKTITGESSWRTPASISIAELAQRQETPEPKGDKGDKGDTGAQGIQGLKGDKGEPGAKGDKGDKGDTGVQGIQGLKGRANASKFDACRLGRAVKDAIAPEKTVNDSKPVLEIRFAQHGILNNDC